MRRDLLKTIRVATVGAALGSAVIGIPQPAEAGVVRVEGTAVVYTAGNNEANTIVVNPRGRSTSPPVSSSTVSR